MGNLEPKPKSLVWRFGIQAKVPCEVTKDPHRTFNLWKYTTKCTQDFNCFHLCGHGFMTLNF